jgi:hypothetical protein
MVDEGCGGSFIFICVGICARLKIVDMAIHFGTCSAEYFLGFVAVAGRLVVPAARRATPGWGLLPVFVGAHVVVVVVVCLLL